MFGSRKVGKTVLLSLLGLSMTFVAPPPALRALGAPCTPRVETASAANDVVAVADKMVITRSELEQAELAYKAAKKKDELSKAEIAGLLEDLIRRHLLLRIAAVKSYKKDPGVVAKVNDYENTLIVARWAEDKIRSKVRVTDREARTYYENNRQEFRTPPRVKASYILLRTRGEAEMVQKKLRGGADFAQLAKQYSIDLPTGQRGGLIGTISESKKPSALGKVLFLLARGETSDIITTKAGYAIFRADQLYPPGFKPYEVVANDIREQLFRKKAHDSFKQIVQNIEKNAGLKIFSDRLAAIEQSGQHAPASTDQQKTSANSVIAGK